MLKRRAKARKILGAASIAFVTYLAPAARAGTVYVDISGQYVPWGYRFIQQGIDAASDGDTVLVFQGAYPENIHFHGKNIVVAGNWALIHGREDGPAVTFAGTEDETCVLQGFTIRYGIAESGGGICGGDQLNHTHATIVNNMILGNQAGRGGGIAYCDGVIRNNTIAQNHAESSGGGLYECDGTIQNNNIVGNSCDGWGGGLHFCDGPIQNNTIAGNSAVGLGGGSYFCGNPIQNNTIAGNSASRGGGLFGGRGPIQNNTITGNSAQASGGGLNGYHGAIQNNIIVGNSAEESGGGLMSCDGTIQNNTIIGNSAGWRGGGLAFCSDGSIHNNTITGNSAGWEGGGLFLCQRTTIRNSILWGNTAPSGAQLDDESSIPTYSCIEGWTGGGEGNITDDPRFVDRDGPDSDPETYEDNDYRLSAASPCIDVGDNSALATPPGLDLDGNLRVVIGDRSLKVDMGAYEYNSSPLQITEVSPVGSGRLRVLWKSQPNDSYTIWSCADLSTGTWIEAGTVPSHGAETPWVDGAASGHMKFYRVEMQ